MQGCRRRLNGNQEGARRTRLCSTMKNTLSAKNFGTKYFSEKICGGKNFGGILTISVINFGGIRKNFGVVNLN